ncbi:MAG: AAA family ATPase [Burkholderiaceae bacterium]|nr:AAA family ATPase [Burkholderiaceae bacterium]
MHEADRARSALHSLDSGCPRDEWVSLAMAAKAAGLGFDDFHKWSRPARNYRNEADCAAVWRSIDETGGIGAGTLFAKAREAGWSEPINGHARPHQRAQEPRRTEQRAERPPFDFAAVWRDSEAATADHPYIARKLGLPDGLRVYRGSLSVAGQSLDGALLVPVHGADGELQSWQAIPPEGEKRSAPGAPIRGGSFVVGGAVRDDVYLAEGIGQAWSAHQATGKPAVCCFGACNVEAIARQMRERYPVTRIVVVADAGKEREAKRISRAVGGAWVAMPEGAPSNFDLNDYHARMLSRQPGPLGDVDALTLVAELLAQTHEAEPEPRPDYASLADLETDPPPPRRWVIDQWLPRGTVTALFGGGGIGKSLLIQQAATCIANGVGILGAAVTRGPVLAYLCEDDNNEVRRRQRDILAHLGRSASYSAEGLHIAGRAGYDNVMMTFGPDRLPIPAPFLSEVERECERIRPAVLMLDNIAQLFGGLENDRFMVTAFANRLAGIAHRFDCAVLLLGHVAKTQGSEYSGSTAWEAAVRTRLWMERREDGLIEMHRRKANYAGHSEALTLAREHFDADPQAAAMSVRRVMREGSEA